MRQLLKGTLTACSERWTKGTTEKWKRHLMDDEVNYHLTQFLTGHGYFKLYLFRKNMVWTPDCLSCGRDRDGSKHTFFMYPRWTTDRCNLEQKTGGRQHCEKDVTKRSLLDSSGNRSWWCPERREVRGMRGLRLTDDGWMEIEWTCVWKGTLRE